MTSCNAKPHCEWCAKPKYAAVIAAAGANRRAREVAEELGMNKNTVGTILTSAKAKGCTTWESVGHTPRGPSTIERQVLCRLPECKKAFTTKRGGVGGYGWCSPAHQREGKRRGIGIYKQEDSRALGPAEPLIRADTEAVWRRCLDAARAEVTEKDMVERFGHPGMVDEAIAQARREGFRQPFKGRGLGSTLAWLPAGMPVW